MTWSFVTGSVLVLTGSAALGAPGEARSFLTLA
jgi:hypothetical protein